VAGRGGGETLTTVIVEDEDLYRDLLGAVLSQQPGLQVLGAYADGGSALAAIPGLNPRTALLDIELGEGLNGVQLGLELRRHLPDLGIILLSNHDDPRFFRAVPRAMFTGWSYLLKKSVSDADALVRAIEGAAAGFVVLDPRLDAGMQPRAQGRLARLTPRQREILALIAQGFTNAAIAERLTIAEKSVENQTNALYQRLGIDRDDRALHPRVKATTVYLEESVYLPAGRSARLPPARP
jgi:DNA-binding NarL/FixJ family response regulator